MIKARLSSTAAFHFRLTRNPKTTAFTNAGRKSKPKKTGALPSAIAKKVPMIMLMPPVKGPNIIPYNGARLSETENEAERPIIGPNGMSLITP